MNRVRCRCLIRAATGPDDLIFPEIEQPVSSNGEIFSPSQSGDSVYSETFAEIYQDTTSPFRPNITSYTPSASPPSYASSTSSTSPYSFPASTRSMLADEDSDFGPTYGGGRRSHGPSDGENGTGNEIGRQADPNFAQISIYTGEDERFAYKRARSRLWELCSARWWSKKDWWRPLSLESRRWEGRQPKAAEALAPEPSEGVAKLFRHGTSPFRTAVEPPPKISWTHAWGMMRWGKRAGVWGKGPEGLKDRERSRKGNSDGDT